MLSARLKELREELGLTQEEVANKLNISRQAYANWETDRSEPSIEMLINLSKFYDVSIDYLCGSSEIKVNIHNDNRLSEYINECVLLYNKFLKDQN